MQAGNDQREKIKDSDLDPPALQQSPLTESHSSYIYPDLPEEKVEERMKEFRGVLELECLQPTCKECTRMREEVFWERCY